MTRAATISITATTAGTVLLAAGVRSDPKQAFFSYLAAWVFAVSVGVGALLWVQMTHALNAGWMIVLRRRAEDILGALPVLALLFLPVLLGLRQLYPWAAPPNEWDEHLRTAVLSKRAWLSTSWFTARSLFYLVAWIVVAELLRRCSRAQDTSPSPELVTKLRTIAAASLPFVGFTMTFAAFDWLMSLDPAWSSSAFGIYLFSGAFGGATGLLCLVVFGSFRSRIDEATCEHSHALGRVLFTFVIFWAYIAFSQYLLIWIADLPEEVGWIKLRTTGSWGGLAIALGSIRFVLPFFALLSRDLKRRPRVLSCMGAWLFVAHYMDVYWMVLPNLHSAFRPHWLDVAALLVVLGASTSAVVFRSHRGPDMPLGDPRLATGLRYKAS